MYNHEQGPSTASVLLSDFLKKGIVANDLTARDIQYVYRSIPSELPRVDINAALQLLPTETPSYRCDKPTALIVETRPLENLIPSIKLVHDLLSIPIHLVHGQDNRDLIRNGALQSLINTGAIFTSELHGQLSDTERYNAVLMHPSFWEQLIGRGKILVFQADAILCPDSSFSLSDFLEFDYIGSAWGRLRPEKLVVDGGNGGLSLRDWKAAMECLSRYPAANWRGGEDTYFCFHTELIGGRVGNADECARFGTQFRFNYKSFGAHKPNSMPLSDQLLFLAYCPEASRVMPGKRLSQKAAIAAALRRSGAGQVLCSLLNRGRTR